MTTGSVCHDRASEDSSEGVFCPLCGGAQTEDYLKAGKYQISHCSSCTHKFVSKGFCVSELVDAYEKNYYSPDSLENVTGYNDYLGKAAIRIKGFEDRFKELKGFTVSHGSLLDFGCAVGLFLKVARDAGWSTLGLERSGWAAEFGRREYGLTILRGDEEEMSGFAQQFDVVTMWDVLEHLEDPRRAVESAAKWLKPNGILALNTINISSLGARLAGAEWRHLAPPFHLQYFTRYSLTNLLRTAGFKILAVRTQGTMLEARKEPVRLSRVMASIEGLITHWRAAPIVDSLQLLDEVRVFAKRESATS